MNEILEIAPSKFTNYPVEFSQEEIKKFDERPLCPVCNSQKQKTALEIGAQDWTNAIAVNQCQACGHIYYKNSPPLEWMLNYYKEDWMQSHDNEKVMKAAPIRPRNKVADLLSSLGISTADNPQIFDVGVGPGSLLKGLQAKGYRGLYGCEQSPSRHQIVSREFGNAIYNAGYQDVRTNQKFDVIYSNHVLEHIYDPKDFIKWATEQLNKTGIIAIFVPNAEYESVFGQAFFLPHLHSFSYSSLEALGREFGFQTAFWKGCRHDEICAVFFKKGTRLAKKNLFTGFEMTKYSIQDLLKRLQGPWSEPMGKNEKSITLTYHIPDLLSSEQTVWRSYARLSPFAGWYIKQVRNLIGWCERHNFKKSVRRLPLLLKLISKTGHQVKTFGYIKIRNADTHPNSVPRVSYKGKALLLLK